MPSAKPAMLAKTRSPWGMAFLLFYQAFFLNVVVPGHTRGAITLDGKHASAPCCCCCCTSRNSSAGHGKAAPSQRDKDNCAICSLAAGLTSTPPFVITIAELGLLERLPVPESAGVVELELIPTYLACGPPLSSARV